MDINLPPPINWQDFERWSLLALEIKMGMRFSKCGRSGQLQDGIDLYSTGNNDVIAVQCKNVKKITESIITQEIEKIQRVKYKIYRYIVCTTAPIDKKIQEFIINSNQNNKFFVPVEIMFWDDIKLILTNDEKLYKRYLEEVGILKFIEPDLQYKRDCKIIEIILGSICIQDIKMYLNELPKFIYDRFLTYYWEMYNEKYHQHIKYINDNNLKEIFTIIYDEWSKIIDVGISHYIPIGNTNRLVFYMPMDIFESDDDEKDYNKILNLSNKLYVELNRLEEYIMSNYQIIDLLELSENGRKSADDIDKRINRFFT